MTLQADTFLGIDISYLIAIAIMIPILVFAFWLAWLNYRAIKKHLIRLNQDIDVRSISSNVAEGEFTRDGITLPFSYSYIISSNGTGSSVNVYLRTSFTSSFVIAHRDIPESFDDTFSIRKYSSLNIDYLEGRYRIYGENERFLGRFLNNKEVEAAIKSLLSLGFNCIDCGEQVTVSWRFYDADKDFRDGLIRDTLALLFQLHLAGQKYREGN